MTFATTRLRPIYLMWMQPIWGRLNMGDKRTLHILFWFFPVAAFVLASVVGYFGKHGISVELYFKFVFGGFFSSVIIFLVLWFFLFIASLASLDSPANAQLVPKLRANLRIATLIPSLVLPIFFYLVAHTLSDKMTWLVWLFCSVFLTGAVAGVRTWLGYFLGFILSQLGVAQDYFDIVGYLHANQISVILLTLIITVLCVFWVFDSPVEMGFKRLQRRENWLKASRGEARAELGFFDFPSKPYSLQFNSFVSGKQSSSRLLMLVFHCDVWSFLMAVTLVLSFVVFLNFCLISSVENFPLSSALTLVLMCVPMLILYTVFLPISIFYEMYRTRFEQSLLVLVPVARGYALKAAEANRFLLKIYLQFALFSLVSVSVSIATVTMHELLIDALVLGWASSLISSLSLTRDHTKIKSIRDLRVLFYMLSIVVVFGLSMAVVCYVPTISCYGMGGLIVVSVLFVLRKKMHQMAHLDPMFPVGRGV